MSWQATSYVKALQRCPDGAPMTRGQKLLALVLADYHNSHSCEAWPSIPRLAKEALSSLSQAKRDLAYLEEHNLIRRVLPKKSGRGFGCSYQFIALDSAEGVHGEPVSGEKRGSEGVLKGSMVTPEGVQKGSMGSNAIRKSKEHRTIELRTCEICAGEKLVHLDSHVPGKRRLIPCPRCCGAEENALGDLMFSQR
jgi:hypothetical protein